MIVEEDIIFFHNLAHDPHHTLDGLSDMHQKDLVIRLPLYGKGYNMEYRTACAMNMIKERQQTQQILYDHKTAKFASAFDSKSTIEYKKR